MLQPDVGERVAGRYLLEREIAKGGMGAVWAGRDDKLKRSVAIKLLKPTWDANSDARMRFEREATAVAQLQCPNVVQIFDYGVDREVPYIVMELLDGEDLHHRLKRVRRLSIDDLARIMWQTAKALGVAHGAGIVHRDLKPANIFLVRMAEDEIAKVLDFGVAKATDDEEEDEEHVTRAGTILGTPQFMSPEQARGLVGSIDHRSDLWSLGVIAYRALTGTLPFKGKTAADAIIAIITAPYPLASDIAPDLPPEVDHFFKKALAKDPTRRFSSAREMALAFGNITPMSVPSLRLPEPALREIARKAEEAEAQARRPGALPIPRKGRPLPPRKKPPARPGRAPLPSHSEFGVGSSDRASASGIDFSADLSPSSSGRIPIPDIGALSARAVDSAAEAEPSAPPSGLDLAWPTPGSGPGSGSYSSQVSRPSGELGLLTPPPQSSPSSLDMALVTPPPDTMASQLETGSSQSSLRGLLIEADPVAARRRARGRTIAIVAAFAFVGVVGVVFGAGVFGATPAPSETLQAAPAAPQPAAEVDEASSTERASADEQQDESGREEDSDEAADETAEADDSDVDAGAAALVQPIPRRPRPVAVPKPRNTAPAATATAPTKPKPADPFAERL